MLSQVARNLVERAKVALAEAQDVCAADAYRSMEPKTGASRKAAAKLVRALELLEKV